MKFLTFYSTWVIGGDHLSARTCYAIVLNSVAPKPPKEALFVVSVINGIKPPDDLRNKTPMP